MIANLNLGRQSLYRVPLWIGYIHFCINVHFTPKVRLMLWINIWTSLLGKELRWKSVLPFALFLWFCPVERILVSSLLLLIPEYILELEFQIFSGSISFRKSLTKLRKFKNANFETISKENNFCHILIFSTRMTS